MVIIVEGDALPYEETIQYLYNLQLHGVQPGLERIRLLLSLLGNPQTRFPSVHIGGTNGKGSTCAMTASILQQAGYRVGLYTSPHLIDFSERITINGIPIPKESVVRGTDRLKGIIHKAEIRITFFELITALAFCYFAEAAVDIAVIEVGLGGRFDATNVLTPCVTAITQIDLDHERYLGTTVLNIANEKAGIIKEGTPVVTGAKQTEVLARFQAVADAHNAPLFQLGRDMTVLGEDPDAFLYRGLSERTVHCPLLGKHQMDNAGIALKIIETLQPMHRLTQRPFPVSENDIMEGMRRVQWQGRLQVIQSHPMILLDGAHNPSAANVLVGYLQDVDPYRSGRHIIIAGILQEKNLQEILSLITVWADEIVLTRPDISRAADPADLLALVKRPIVKTVQKTIAQAISSVEARMQSNDTLVITGSLYTVGEALAYFKGVALSPIRG